MANRWVKAEIVTDLIFLGSKIMVNSDCSYEMKKCLLLGRKAITNLDSILKNRDTTLPTKVHLVNAMVFPLVMYGCERWTIKKAECWRIDAFELRCWKRLLRVPWTARRSNQLILKEISLNIHWKDWCWSWSSNTSVTWCEELTHCKRLMVGKIEGRKRRAMTKDEMVGWHHRLDRHEFEQALGVGDGQGGLACCSPWGRKESDTTEQLNWLNRNTVTWPSWMVVRMKKTRTKKFTPTNHTPLPF